MNAIDYRVSLDMLDVSSQTTIKAKKGDSACKIHITLNENGKIYRISDGSSATFSAKKSDGTFVYDNCTIENNTIVYDFMSSVSEDGTCQISACEGVVSCEVALLNDKSEKLTSPRFTLIIDGTVYNGEEITSSPEANVLKELIKEADDAVNSANNMVADIEQKLANGDFVGEKGEKGDKGDKGDKGGDADQTYDPTSTNAQSGKAVAEALSKVDAEIGDIEATLDTVKLPISKGSGKGSTVINEGIASGDYSIAGGTTDKEFIEDLVGATVSAITKLNKTEAQGALSISLGADNITQSGGSVALGYKNISGAKGYYFDDIDFTNKTITLSTTRRTSTLLTPTYPSSVDWEVGDRLFIVNDDRYFLTISAVNENIITVEELPFSEIMYSSTLLLYTYSNPCDRTIVNIDKPKSGSVIVGWGAIGIGAYNTTIGNNSYGMGYKNSVVGDFGGAFGQENIVGYSAFATGIKNKALGKTSIAEGVNTQSTGIGSHSGGGDTNASGDFSNAYGKGTKALGYASFAQGLNSEAQGEVSFAVGNTTKAKGKGTVALGKGTEAERDYAVALGYETYARGRYSLATGSKTTSYTDNTFASGENTYAGYKNQFVAGQFNNNKKDTLFEIGNGTSEERTNAFEVYKDGTAKLKVQGETENSVVIKQYVDNKISSLNNTLFDFIYPVNSIYITADDKFNPETYFGGVWEVAEQINSTISTDKITYWKRTH